jgi:hypothetical protein
MTFHALKFSPCNSLTQAIPSTPIHQKMGNAKLEMLSILSIARKDVSDSRPDTTASSGLGMAISLGLAT